MQVYKPCEDSRWQGKLVWSYSWQYLKSTTQCDQEMKRINVRKQDMIHKLEKSKTQVV